MPKGTDLQDKSLIKALIQTKDWDKAILKEYIEKHPEVQQRAIDEKKTIEQVVGTVDLSYKWRNNLKYGQDHLARLTLLADTLPPEKRQDLFSIKSILDLVKSILGGHSTFVNDANRLKLKLQEGELEYNELSDEYYKIRSRLPRDQVELYEKTETERLFRPKAAALEEIRNQIKTIEDAAAAWKSEILLQQSIAEIAATVAKECLDFLVQYYTAHIDDPGMQKVFTTLFTDTKLQLDSILRQVNDKKEQTRLAEELRKQKAKERKERAQIIPPAAPRTGPESAHVQKS